MTTLQQRKQASISLFAWLSNSSTRDEPIRGGAKTIAVLLAQGADMKGTDSARKSLVFHLLQLDPKFWKAVTAHCQTIGGQALNDVVTSSLRLNPDMFHVAAFKGKASALQEIFETVKTLPCQADVVKALLEAHPATGNLVPLQVAAKYGKDHLLRIFLEYTVNAPPVLVRDAFILAASSCDTPGNKSRECIQQCCEWLVKQKQEHITIEGLWPARIFARGSQALRLACELVPAGWIDTEKHNTILHFACLQGDTEAVRVCVERPDVARLVSATNLKGQSALHLALSFGFPECVRLLLAANADPEKGDDYHNTPLHQAIYVITHSGSTPGLEESLRIFTYFDGRTTGLAEQTLRTHLTNTDVDPVREAAVVTLLAALPSTEHLIPELIASDVGCRALLTLIQRHILSPRLISAEFVIQAISNQWSIERLHVLFSFASLDQGRSSDGLTPLAFCAINVQYIEQLELLVEMSANVHKTDNEGRTALHHAAASSNQDAVRLLLSVGAERTVVDLHGRVPSDYVRPNTPRAPQLLHMLRSSSPRALRRLSESPPTSPFNLSTEVNQLSTQEDDTFSSDALSLVPEAILMAFDDDDVDQLKHSTTNASSASININRGDHQQHHYHHAVLSPQFVLSSSMSSSTSSSLSSSFPSSSDRTAETFPDFAHTPLSQSMGSPLSPSPFSFDYRSSSVSAGVFKPVSATSTGSIPIPQQQSQQQQQQQARRNSAPFVTARPISFTRSVGFTAAPTSAFASPASSDVSQLPTSALLPIGSPTARSSPLFSQTTATNLPSSLMSGNRSAQVNFLREQQDPFSFRFLVDLAASEPLYPTVLSTI